MILTNKKKGGKWLLIHAELQMYIRGVPQEGESLLSPYFISAVLG